MKIKAKPSKAFVLSLVLACYINGEKAKASIVTLINHEQSPLKINVVSFPNRTSYCEKCIESPLYGENERTIVVLKEALKGEEFFSILDVTNGFLGSSECSKLSVFKNYQVSFYETTLGTRCTRKEI